MASIRKRNSKWHAQVRRVGHKSQCNSFISKSDAQAWVRMIESDMDKRVLPVNTNILKELTVGDLIERYRDNVTIHHRGKEAEIVRLNVFLRYDWAKLTLIQITPYTFVEHRDNRNKQVSAGTIIRELGLLRAIFEIARNEWDIPLHENPLVKVRKPSQPESRTRRLEDNELDTLLLDNLKCKDDWLTAGILLAIETGMRRGELFNVTANAFRLAWERCKRRAAKKIPAIVDLRFHDLRHEAISRFFELGLSVPEVALISGHRDPRMLFKYTHLKPENLVLKLK